MKQGERLAIFSLGFHLGIFLALGIILFLMSDCV